MALYGSAHWQNRYGKDVDGKSAWKNEMRVIAQAIGYTGQVFGFDTSIVPARDGHLVEYHPQHGQRKCRIFYKANDSSDFTTRNATGPDLTRQTHRSIVTFRSETTGDGVRVNMGRVTHVSASHAVGLSELNYFLRQISFKV